MFKILLRSLEHTFWFQLQERKEVKSAKSFYISPAVSYISLLFSAMHRIHIWAGTEGLCYQSNRALPDITSGREVRKIVKIRTVWKPDVFLPRRQTFKI
jgi:hypothetical protein